MAAIPPTSVKYFWGRISREEAEEIMLNRGLKNGLYLLRESTSNQGNYALSLSLGDSIHHYNIERQRDGMVMIQDGKKFSGPVELVKHHEGHLDGFLTHPTLPCERGNEPCMAYKGVTMHELDQILMEKINRMKLKGRQLENALGPQRQKLLQDIVKNLHEEQPWFHGNITRNDAHDRLIRSGHMDGKFIVRPRDDNTFALSLSHGNDTKHYKIDFQTRPNGKNYAIEDGPQFESIMQLVDHYYNKTDGLLCKLKTPCERPNYQKQFRTLNLNNDVTDNMAYGIVPGSQAGSVQGGLPKRPTAPLPVLPKPAIAAITPPKRAVPALTNNNDRHSVMRHPKSPLPAPPTGGAVGGLAFPSMNGGAHSIDSRPPVPIPVDVSSDGVYGSVDVRNQVWDDPDLPDAAPSTSQSSEADLQKIYDLVPRNDKTFNLKSHQISTTKELGSGCFGSVMEGTCKQGNDNIPVAIKTLKTDDVSTNDSEILQEAKLMSGLNHRNVVRMIGVCKGPPIMLVLELAPMGPLNKALKKKEMTQPNIYTVMYQVAQGMAYLESISFVHRDLAARNVLLVNRNFAKISDFGMSKALGMGSNYYTASEAGKWPLKWYAPESIYYWKFDSKSDVWSFGVTLWEAMSFGAKPYRGMKGQDILNLIEEGRRLEKPSNCPHPVYEIMKRCWEYKKKRRPTFEQLVPMTQFIAEGRV